MTTAPSVRFRARWSRDVIALTVAFSLLMGGPALYNLARGRWVIGTFLAALYLLIFTQGVRGYALAGSELLIRRPLWTTRWPLDAATTAELRPRVMANSWRVWGNSGVFGITGRFAGSDLGRYHAYVTDPEKTVVLKTSRGIVVVSPDQPEAFLAALPAPPGPARAA
jgi:hypothetical protein